MLVLIYHYNKYDISLYYTYIHIIHLTVNKCEHVCVCVTLLESIGTRVLRCTVLTRTCDTNG